MRTSFRVAAFAVCAGALASGCKLGHWAKRTLSQDSQPLHASARNEPLPAMASQGSELMARAERFTRTFSPPPAFTERKCSDSVGAESAAAAVLIRRVVDARTDAKTLLPMKLRREIESRELQLLDEALRRGALDQQSGVARTSRAALVLERSADTRHASSAPQARQALERLEQHRFMGVYHVVDYREPQLIYNMQKNRRQWTKGVFRAWLSVYSSEPLASAADAAREPLCTALVYVENDATEVPTSRRRRDETQQALLLQLSEFARAASPAALRKISTHLVFAD